MMQSQEGKETLPDSADEVGTLTRPQAGPIVSVTVTACPTLRSWPWNYTGAVRLQLVLHAVIQ